MKILNSYSDKTLNKACSLQKTDVPLSSTTKILSTLLTTSAECNLRNLTYLQLRELLLSRIYTDHSKMPDAMLKFNDIPSHVSAAKTEEGISFIKIQIGTRFFQQVRPEWYIGDYFSPEDGVAADKLGISKLVKSQKDPSKLVDRVPIEIAIKSNKKPLGALTVARECTDNWSTGSPVHCSGGAKQFFMPLCPKEKGDHFAIIMRPEYEHRRADIEAIAKKNGIELLAPDDFEKQHGALVSFDENYRVVGLGDVESRLECIDSERRATQLVQIGRLHLAIEHLKKRLQFSDHPSIRAVLGGLYGAIGNQQEAERLLGSVLSNKQNEELSLTIQHHLALVNKDTGKAIQQLEKLLTENYDKKGEAYLDLSRLYNQKASNFSDELTWRNFDATGKCSDVHDEYAKKAEEYAEKSLKCQLSTFDRILTLMELGYAQRKGRKVEEALKNLTEAYKLIENVVTPDKDFLKLSLELGIGLSACRVKGALCGNQTPLAFLDSVSEKIKQIDFMERRSLFMRWIGNNCNDLFTPGWIFNKQTSDDTHGTKLIAAYREMFPIQVDRICDRLRNNKIEELELAYLGEEGSAGISDDDFKKIAVAISENTSLKRLYLRKFSGKSQLDRCERLFEALIQAQKNGQRLEYLSYSGARLGNDKAFDKIIQFYRENESLKILQPALFDFKNPNKMKELAEAIGKLPELTTLLLGVIPCPEAGESLVKAFKAYQSPLKHLYPFPRPIADEYATAKWNNEVLMEFKEELESQG